MANPHFDTAVKDAMAMPVTPVEVSAFDFERFAAQAEESDRRYAAFWRRREGVAVWQRVRAGEVFRDACRDRRESLRWQLGGLTRSLEYLTDAPAYLEPWYGIGTTASAFGAEYEWLPGQAPAVRPPSASLSSRWVPRDPAQVPILRATRETIEYFLEQTRGRVPISWCDIQSPLNVATGLVSTTEFMLGLVEQPERVRALLAAATEELIRFTQAQSAWIGGALARPGHGFASSRAGAGIGLSTDNLIMISPALFERYCVAATASIGGHFGGSAIHSCGNWGRWLPAVKKIANLLMVDGAFSPQTDPDCNRCEEFRDALVDTGIVLQARIVGGPEDVMERVRRLWRPGLKLLVVTHVQDPRAQHRLYHEIHRHCGQE